tara:strand:+ start:3435 stop:4295 length:861 start_codon:yes stop_codon:yes gene_type:complete
MSYQPQTTDEDVLFGMEYLQEICGDRPVVAERYVEYKGIFGGYMDAFCRIDDTVHIFDPKTGFTSAEHYKPQLAGYALASMEEEGVDKAVCHLIMWEQRHTCSWDLTKEQAAAEVMEIIAQHQNPDSKPHPNKYCQWCANLTSCEGVSREVAEVLVSGLPTHFDSKEELGRAMHVRKLVTAWCDGVKKLADAQSKEGGSLPGWKIAKVKGRDKISDLNKHAVRDCVLEYISPDEFLECCTISMSKLKAKFPDQDLPFAHLIEKGSSFFRYEPEKDLIESKSTNDKN